MTARFDLIGLVVDDLAASLAFYRRLGLDVPADADDEPHVEVTLPGGLRLAWDTVETIRSFDSSWTPPDGERRAFGLAFACDDPAEVDATYADLVGPATGPPRALGRVLGPALRQRARSGRQQRRPVRAAARHLTSWPSGTPARPHVARQVGLVGVARPTAVAAKATPLRASPSAALQAQDATQQLGPVAERVGAAATELAGAQPEGVRVGGHARSGAHQVDDGVDERMARFRRSKAGEGDGLELGLGLVGGGQAVSGRGPSRPRCRRGGPVGRATRGRARRRRAAEPGSEPQPGDDRPASNT